MKKIITGLFILIISLGGVAYGQKLVQVWESSDEVLKTPESVLYDETRDVIFVSNINNGPSDKDGNGFISVLNADGTVKELNWVQGLNAPKGMAIHNGKLYVSDIDELVEIDIKKKKVAEIYNAPNSLFLNDVTASDDGRIFVSDTRTGRIHVLENGKFTVWHEGEPLVQPNGLLAEGDKLFVGDLKIFEFDLKTKKAKPLIVDTGGVDGLEKNNNGNFVYSNWGGIVTLYKDGKKITMHDTSEQEINTADIDFAHKLNLVLVPTFYDNRIVAYKIE